MTDKQESEQEKNVAVTLKETELDRVTGGASYIYSPAMKSKGGLDLSSEPPKN